MVKARTSPLFLLFKVSAVEKVKSVIKTSPKDGNSTEILPTLSELKSQDLSTGQSPYTFQDIMGLTIGT